MAETSNAEFKPESQNCPHCNYPVGKPFDRKAEHIEATPKQSSFCFCVRCLGVCFIHADKPIEKVGNKEFYAMILLRTKEVLTMMEMTLVLNKNLPRIDAEKN